MNPVSIRLFNQQLIAPQFSTPTEVVSYMGAMQAQEYRMMRWAVAMRTPKHWIGINPSTAPDDLLKELTRNSYEIVKAKYASKRRLNIQKRKREI